MASETAEGDQNKAEFVKETVIYSEKTLDI